MRVRSKWVWVAFLLALLIFAVVGFGLLESAALRDPEGLTLSQFIVNVSRAWPPIMIIATAVIVFPMGMLTTHFFWPWVPRHLRAPCGQCGKTILLEEPK